MVLMFSLSKFFSRRGQSEVSRAGGGFSDGSTTKLLSAYNQNSLLSVENSISRNLPECFPSLSLSPSSFSSSPSQPCSQCFPLPFVKYLQTKVFNNNDMTSLLSHHVLRTRRLSVPLKASQLKGFEFCVNVCLDRCEPGVV